MVSSLYTTDMKNLAKFLLLLLAYNAMADGPVIQTSPFTRQLLTAPDAGAARARLGVVATNNWPVTNLALQTPVVIGGTQTGATNINPAISGATFTGTNSGGTFSSTTNVNPVVTGGTQTGTTNVNPVVTGGTQTGTTNVNPVVIGGTQTGTTNVNPVVTGGTQTGTTNVTQLTAFSFTNSPLFQLASHTISQSYFDQVKMPVVFWNSFGAYGLSVNLAAISNYVIALDNSPLRFLGRRFVVFLDGCWEATNTDGTAWDAKGILQCNTNNFPGGIAYVSSLVHQHGYSFGLFLQNGLYNDAGAPFHGILSNTFGNFTYYITNANVDFFRGHGDWGTTPQNAFDQQIEASLACVMSGQKVIYIPQDMWPDDTAGTTWFKQYSAYYGRFFASSTTLSGSSFPDQPSFTQFRGFFNYTLTNFPSLYWEQIPFNWNPSTIGDQIWREDRVGATINAIFSVNFYCLNTHPEQPLYQSAMLPVDLIQRVDFDPLRAMPNLISGSSSSSTNIWMKPMQNDSFTVAEINWDTTNPAQFSYTVPTNFPGYWVHDCWSNRDFYATAGKVLTNTLAAPDASVLVFYPATQIPNVSVTNNSVSANPLYEGLIFDMPLTEAPGSTSVASYSQNISTTNLYGVFPSQPALFGTLTGYCIWTNGQVGFAVQTSNSAPEYDILSSIINCIEFPAIPGLTNLSAFTLSCTFRQGAGPNYPVLFDYFQDGQPTPFALYLNPSSDYIELNIATTTTNAVFYFSNAAAGDGNWHQVSVAYNSANLAVYVDGTLSQTWTVTGPLNVPTSPQAYIGAMTGGAVNQVRFWNRCLNANEVKLLYRQSFPP
jgi:hypothetical protein